MHDINWIGSVHLDRKNKIVSLSVVIVAVLIVVPASYYTSQVLLSGKIISVKNGSTNVTWTANFTSTEHHLSEISSIANISEKDKPNSTLSLSVLGGSIEPGSSTYNGGPGPYRFFFIIYFNGILSSNLNPSSLVFSISGRTPLDNSSIYEYYVPQTLTFYNLTYNQNELYNSLWFSGGHNGSRSYNFGFNINSTEKANLSSVQFGSGQYFNNSEPDFSASFYSLSKTIPVSLTFAVSLVGLSKPVTSIVSIHILIT